MIAGIKLLLLRNTEYMQFIRNFLTIVQQNDVVALNVEQQYNKLLQMAAVLKKLFAIEKGSAITTQVAGQDERRDRALLGITGIVNTYAWHFNPDTVKHAHNLARHIKQFGSRINKKNYQAETTIINKLISDFKTRTELVAAVEVLQIKDWCNELEAANIAFNAAYLQRTQQKAANKTITKVAQRQKINTAYYELRDFIDSYFTINNGAAPYDKVTEELNALIKQYNDMMASR